MANVIVVGLAKSGMDAARLLAQRQDTVFITELKNDFVVKSNVDILVREAVVRPCNVELGAHSEKLIRCSDLMVLSPGVKRDSIPIKLALENNIPVISELELAFSMCQAPVIAVTGTSGKTTTATLISRMLKSDGHDAVLCGNIGNPFSGEIKKINKNSVVVVEVSSFQLEFIHKFKPKISIILNISANHLDRHSSMDEYISAKSKIFSNQDENDILFLNSRDETLTCLAGDNGIRAKVEFFDKFKDFRQKFGIENDDFLAGMSAASMMNVSEDKMLAEIKNFKGIEHRLEYVANVNGIDFINDSKATTISSIEWALKSMDGNIVLIMGGRYKGGDFGMLKNLIKDKVDFIISIGEARPQIKKGLTGVKKIIEADDLRWAVIEGFSRSKKGGKVLFSPGCSSFDMFANYEERGNIFKEIVKTL